MQHIDGLGLKRSTHHFLTHNVKTLKISVFFNIYRTQH